MKIKSYFSGFKSFGFEYRTLSNYWIFSEKYLNPLLKLQEERTEDKLFSLFEEMLTHLTKQMQYEEIAQKYTETKKKLLIS